MQTHTRTSLSMNIHPENCCAEKDNKIKNKRMTLIHARTDYPAQCNHGILSGDREHIQHRCRLHLRHFTRAFKLFDMFSSTLCVSDCPSLILCPPHSLVVHSHHPSSLRRANTTRRRRRRRRRRRGRRQPPRRRRRRVEKRQ